MPEPITSSSVIFGPMLRAFTWFYDTWRKNTKASIEDRRRAYKEHFEPAYVRLETIHKNYLECFHDFYDICRKFETPSKDMLHKFQKFSIEYATWREDLRNFSLVAEQIAKGFRRKEEQEAIEEFRKALVNYFNVSIPSGEFQHWPSWFSSFISEFEEHVRQGRSPWDEEYGSTGVKDPKGTFVERLRTAYLQELPAKWSHVANAKSKIQTVFGV